MTYRGFSEPWLRGTIHKLKTFLGCFKRKIETHWSADFQGAGWYRVILGLKWAKVWRLQNLGQETREGGGLFFDLPAAPVGIQDSRWGPNCCSFWSASDGGRESGRWSGRVGTTWGCSVGTCPLGFIHEPWNLWDLRIEVPLTGLCRQSLLLSFSVFVIHFLSSNERVRPSGAQSWFK